MSTSRSKVYGYMRVSSYDQNEDRQKEALIKAGIKEECIYMDKLSGTTGELAVERAAELCGMSRSTFYRRATEIK